MRVKMKKLINPKMLIALVVFTSTIVFAQGDLRVEKYSKVKISIMDKTDLIEFQKAGLSLEGIKFEEESVELILSEREILTVDNLGYPYQILIEDMAKYYQERSRRSETEMKILEKEMKEKYSDGGFGFGSMGGFYTFDEIVAELDSMRLLYPNIITEKDSIGSSTEGRTIWVVKISDNPDINEGEPEVFYNALVHAREPAGMMSVIYFMYYLLENYETNPEVKYLIDNREFYFLPVINPDGYVYNQTTYPNGGGLWRKNRTDNGNGCYGIDICRNYDYMWGFNNTGSSPDPCHNAYRGSAPFSETETQAVRDLCNGHDFVLDNNFHAYSNVLASPWGYNLEQTPDSTIFNYTIALATQLNNYYNFWHLDNTHQLVYERNGDHLDWQYGEQTTKPKIFAYATEVGNDDDGFWPPPERIFPLAEENVYLNKVLAWGPGIIDNPPHIFEANIDPSTYIQFNDSVSVAAKECNPDNYNSTVTVYVLDSDDNVVDEFQLNKIDTINYVSKYRVPQEENIYHLLLKDSGLQIPSNFYYLENSKFTTAGPITVDSLTLTYNSFVNIYMIKPFLKNNGQTFTIEDISISILTEDSSVTILTDELNLLSLAPGETATPTGSFTFRVDSGFTGLLNFDFEIKSDGWTYWKDSAQIIITETEESKSQVITYNLEQNYPNPFNPATTIKFQIPSMSLVTLKIYDVLGREVKILINEEKAAGRYETEFDASNLSSGIYFYQLRAGNFADSKKMVLIK